MIAVLLMGVLALDVAAQTPTKVDQVVVVKSSRTLTLMSHGKVIRSYKVALGGSPGERRSSREITRHRKATTFWTGGMTRAGSTNPFTFRTRTKKIGRERRSAVLIRAATS